MDETRLRQLLRIGRGLVGELDLDTVLRHVLDAARELTEARYAALGVLDADRRRLDRFLTVGLDDAGRRQIGELPRGLGVLGVLIAEPRPLRLDDVSAHPRSYGFPPGHPKMTTFLGVPVRVGEQVYGNLYLADKAGGGPFGAEDEATVVELADWAGDAIRNARRYSGVRGERDEYARALRVVETTASLAQALAGETAWERVLELVVKRGRALVQARGMLVSVPEGQDLVMTAVAGESDRELLGMRVPIEASIAGHAFRTGRPTRMSDLGVLTKRSPLVMRMDVQAALAVPLRFRGRTVGVLSAYDRLVDGPEFTAEDQRLMEAFATSAAAALATARDVAEQALRRSVQAAERERTHWARELHDQTLQDLAALKFLIDGARRADHGAAGPQLDQSIAHVQGTIAELRGLITDLRPAALDQLGAQPALEALAERVATVNGLPVQLTMDLSHGAQRAGTRLTSEVEAVLYRIVQEALTNVVKHADAAHAWVEIAEDEAGVRVRIRDDGAGFDPRAASEGFGLLGMRERVALVDGTLEIDSSPGEGTTVTATLPGRHRAATDAPDAAGQTTPTEPAA
jgi:signal transduction histidine kinase